MSTQYFFILTCLLLILIGLCTPASATERNEADYTLGPGDEIKMTVFGEQDLSGTYPLDDTGSIAVPLIGEVKLQGITLRNAEHLIGDRLAEGYLVDPSVSLEIMTYRPFYILGEVRKPGGYPYAKSMTALKAVALAGGFTYRARENKVTVKHPDGREETRAAEAEILPGEVVIVEERFF